MKSTRTTDRSDVEKVVLRFFEAAKERDFDEMASLHLRDERFSKFNDFPPYERMDIEEDLAFEQARYTSITDLTYDIEDLRIDLFGSLAVATFYVTHKALLVDNYTFRGRHFEGRSRGTILLLKRGGGWLIAHEHFSRIPDELAFR
ncbi:MAG: YybH family protein [Candidatus Geothermarchaeales archaeon]